MPGDAAAARPGWPDTARHLRVVVALWPGRGRCWRSRADRLMFEACRVKMTASRHWMA